MVDYSEEREPGWSRKVSETWQISESSTRIRLWGRCPKCDCDSVTVVDLTTGVKGPGGAVSPTLDVLVLCSCTSPHPGRPADRSGCGRGGWLTVTLDGAP
ncbi:hypothetical protein FB565_003310 [Actinoplanes lutulentus]|uniref:Uncharacterized protein n=1 Tax=Actinoplanes lutulentus TaxID=1287878 RepID=A0A327Z8I5_9ACTN|nr:hypothetical protein [Actinoplanes lutulentus]MBB2943581.1 hypothetical protein [Actinoplanes lutulentus]RAK27447.1 hypothetical protein B0I29_12381 [Actinoplanes lutulentus]